VADLTFDDLSKKLRGLERAFTDPKLKQIATKMGVEAKKQATKAASADLGGDPKFSGWSPKLDTRFDYIGDGKISFKPTKRAAGPWTVAEFGRNQAAGPRMTGPRLTKTGKVSKAKTKRYNGQTQPKHTASDALDLIERRMPGVVGPEVTKAIKQFFD
jgi:hypothetical protein